LNRVGAMTEPCCTPFLSVKVLLVWSPRQTEPSRSGHSCKDVQDFLAFDHLSELEHDCCQTASYAAVRSMKVAPVFFFISKPASTWLVAASTCSVVFIFENLLVPMVFVLQLAV